MEFLRDGRQRHEFAAVSTLRAPPPAKAAFAWDWLRLKEVRREYDMSHEDGARVLPSPLASS
jgi:hypothetical protein